MKKSKVIVPAMALLLFSTAASITGTVAWFTSNRVFNTSAGSFTAKSIDGNLDVTVHEGVGTHVDTSSNPNTIAVNTGAYLIDGSVDITTGIAWRLSRTATSAADNKYTSFGTKDEKKSDAEDAELKWLYRSDTTNSYYVAMSWSYTFNYTFNTETNNVGIFLDLTNLHSKMTATPDSQTAKGQNQKDIALGFRIGFSATGFQKVWGNNPAAATSLTYVDSAASVDHYTDSNYWYNTPSNYELAPDYGTDNLTRIDRIATINASDKDSNGVASATVNCFAWFEGTDENVVSDTYFQSLSAGMNFYARSDVAAQP